MKRTAREIQNNSNVAALKRARVTLALSRKELAARLKISHKTIEKYENGRDFVSKDRLLKILEAMEISSERFQKIKRGKAVRPREPREKLVVSN